MFTKLQTKGTNVRKSIKGAVDVILTDLLLKKGEGGGFKMIMMRK